MSGFSNQAVRALHRGTRRLSAINSTDSLPCSSALLLSTKAPSRLPDSRVVPRAVLQGSKSATLHGQKTQKTVPRDMVWGSTRRVSDLLELAMPGVELWKKEKINWASAGGSEKASLEQIKEALVNVKLRLREGALDHEERELRQSMGPARRCGEPGDAEKIHTYAASTTDSIAKLKVQLTSIEISVSDKFSLGSRSWVSGRDAVPESGLRCSECNGYKATLFVL